MAGMSLLDVLLVVGGLLLLLVIVMAVRHRSTHNLAGRSPTRDELMVAEEELNLLKGGSLWGDVHQPRFVATGGVRRRRLGRFPD